jgi:polyisoprenyl-phosphate glycosyltransferase
MARKMGFKLSLVIPAYNEAENIRFLLQRVTACTASYPNLEIILVDDGSSDGSSEILRSCQSDFPSLRFISLSRNYGHQAALRAGMEHAIGDCVLCLDADLQHPPELIAEMVLRWQAGADIVNCIRKDLKSLSFFKRTTSRWFYQSLSWISGVPLAPGSSDFRLLDRKVVNILSQLQETDLFFRGIIPTLGFKVAEIDYTPDARKFGTSKYTLHKMLKLALIGMISTSARPLRLATYFAFLTAMGALSFLAYVFYIYFGSQGGVPGWASTLAVVLTIGTMQLLVLGVIGEYLGQVLKETRRRPPYHIAANGGMDDENSTPADADADWHITAAPSRSLYRRRR